MENTSEWQIGSETKGTGIYVRLKGTIEYKYSHNFLSIQDAETFAKDILKITKKLRKFSVGKCAECNEYISNKENYYKLDNKKLVHKRCIGSYGEKEVINEKLKLEVAPEFEIKEIIIEHFVNRDCF